MEPKEILHCVVMAGKQSMTNGFYGNRYKYNNRGMVGNNAFYWVQPKAAK
jgi:hypothetical protein